MPPGWKEGARSPPTPLRPLRARFFWLSCRKKATRSPSASATRMFGQSSAQRRPCVSLQLEQCKRANQIWSVAPACSHLSHNLRQEPERVEFSFVRRKEASAETMWDFRIPAGSCLKTAASPMPLVQASASWSLGLKRNVAIQLAQGLSAASHCLRHSRLSHKRVNSSPRRLQARSWPILMTTIFMPAATSRG